jgi:DNA-binding PadR family transcriptional regulator
VTAVVDNRSRTDLELFLLALIDRGIATPYAFQMAADLSPGATLPVVRRLLSRGLVRRGEPGARRRAAYQLTAKGRHHLAEAWRPLLESAPPPDIDASLRIAALALLSGAKHSRVSTFLQDAAKHRNLTSKRIDEAGQVELAKDAAGGYRWMRARYTKARLACEADLLLQIAEELARTTPRKH